MDVLRRCSTRDGYWHVALIEFADSPNAGLWRLRWTVNAARCCDKAFVGATADPFEVGPGGLETRPVACPECGDEHRAGFWAAPYENVECDWKAGRLAGSDKCWCQANVKYVRIGPKNPPSPPKRPRLRWVREDGVYSTTDPRGRSLVVRRGDEAGWVVETDGEMTWAGRTFVEAVEQAEAAALS